MVLVYNCNGLYCHVFYVYAESDEVHLPDIDETVPSHHGDEDLIGVNHGHQSKSGLCSYLY